MRTDRCSSASSIALLGPTCVRASFSEYKGKDYLASFSAEDLMSSRPTCNFPRIFLKRSMPSAASSVEGTTVIHLLTLLIVSVVFALLWIWLRHRKR